MKVKHIVGIVIAASLLSFVAESPANGLRPPCVNVTIDGSQIRFLSYVAKDDTGLTPTDIIDVSVSDLASHETIWLVTGHDHWDYVPSVTYGSVPNGWRQILPSSGNPPDLELGHRYRVMVVTRFGVNGLGTSFRLGDEPEPRCTPRP